MAITYDVVDEFIEDELDYTWDESSISLADMCPPNTVLIDVIIDPKSNNLYILYVDEEEDLSYFEAASLDGSNTL